MAFINRRTFLKATAATAISTQFAFSDPPKPKRPNILVFLTDDHGQWAQHAYGNSEIRTPNLDRLAARGTRMVNAFTTCPVCSPARASFFTGRMPSQHGIHDWLDETMPGYHHPGLKGQTLIPELLKPAGYHSALVGKWHCGEERVPKPGFDRWFSYWVHQYPHLGQQNFSDNGKHIIENGLQSPLLTNRAIDFIRDQRQQHADDPFFLFVSYVDTHVPHRDAPADLVSLYAKASFSDIPHEKFAPCHGKIREYKAPNAQAEHERLAEYYAAAGSVDREVGRVLDELQAQGILDDTLVVYTGDHGLNAGHHGIWEKGNGTMPQNFLEESIRVACTLSWPNGGIPQNHTLDGIVNHCDLFATLLDVAGVSVPAQINSPGRSYLPQLLGQSAAGFRDCQISEYGNARMIRTDRHKLILRYPFQGVSFPNELYDLHDDPRETVNRFTDPAMAGVVTDLTGKLDAFFKTYSVPERDGMKLESLPTCTNASPWIVAVRQHNRAATQQGA
jgi:arylsulfatase A-like enzyme